MSDQLREPLLGRHLLVVEDEYFLARDLARDLAAAGAMVIGPVATVAEALALVATAAPLDAAFLDVNLGGEMVFPVADALAARGVPFVFVTGYDEIALPPAFSGHARCEKPIDREAVIAAIGMAMTSVRPVSPRG